MHTHTDVQAKSNSGGSQNASCSTEACYRTPKKGKPTASRPRKDGAQTATTRQGEGIDWTLIEAAPGIWSRWRPRGQRLWCQEVSA